MYTLKLHKKVYKFLKSRSLSERRIIKSKLSLLKENPYIHQQLDIKKLKGDFDAYRLRIGKIRIIYQVIDDELLILIISEGNRGDIYKGKT